MRNMSRVRMLEFPQRGDERGYLVIAEGMQDVPFEIRRVFYIYGSDHNVVRGQHANRKTEFVLINVAGTSKVKVKDGEGNEAVFCLDRPHTGIYLPTMVWKDMYDFSPDSVLLVLASEHYDAAEYIRDYDAFVNEVADMSGQKYASGQAAERSVKEGKNGMSPKMEETKQVCDVEKMKQTCDIVADYRNRRIEGRIIDLVPFTEEWIADFVRVRNKERNLYFFNQTYLLTEESQREWYGRYLQRSDDIFWCILDKQGRFLGSVRLYEIDADAEILNHGSFMIDVGVADEAPYALEAEILSLDFAFDILHIRQVINENREDNRVMNSLSEKFGFAFVKNTVIRGVPYRYHLLTEDAYRKRRGKADRIITYWAGRQEEMWTGRHG